jgi:hypothetical protein
MPMKEQQREVYRSARGKEVDLNKLIARNELTPAVGNMKVNARGDKLGPGGKIIAKREQLQAGSIGIPDQISQSEVVETPAPALIAKPVITKKDVKDMDPEGNE